LPHKSGAKINLASQWRIIMYITIKLEHLQRLVDAAEMAYEVHSDCESFKEDDIRNLGVAIGVAQAIMQYHKEVK